MKKRIAFTVDVEARQHSAEKDHVNRLIWGKVNNEELGLGLMMSLAEKCGARLTCFLDYAERDTYGEELLDVGREIARRGHDLQGHMHVAHFNDAFLKERGISRIIDLRKLDRHTADAYVERLTEAHSRVSSKPLLAFRGGGYFMNYPLLESLKSHGFLLDAGYNPIRIQYRDLGEALRAPFFWSNGIFEVPVSALPYLRGHGRKIDYNFNAIHLFGKGDALDCAQRHKAFLKAFFHRFGEQAIATLVLHSFSFLKKDKKGFFTIPLSDAPGKFEAVLAELSEEYEFITLGDLACELEREKSSANPETVEMESFSSHCSICWTPTERFEDYNKKGLKRLCPTCRSLERQRVFMELYEAGTFGERILENKRILHVSPSAVERTIFKQIPGVDVVTVDVRPNVGTDVVANISEMPEVDTGAFDIVFACGMFWAVEHFSEAVAELGRILKPGGVIFAQDKLTPACKTVTLTDKSDITSYYGQEAHDSWRVGTYRNFGELDYAEQFSPYFQGKMHFGKDAATGLPVHWFFGQRKDITPLDDTTATSPDEAVSLTAPLPADQANSGAGRDIPKPLEDGELTAVLRSGGHARFSPQRGELGLFFTGSGKINPEMLNLSLKARRMLRFQDDWSINEEDRKGLSYTPTFALWPQNVRMPYGDISFKYMDPFIEADFEQLGSTDDNGGFVRKMLRGVFAFHDVFSFWEERSLLPEHVHELLWGDAVTGARFAVLTYLLQRAPDERLWRIALDHYLLLASDVFYNPRHNHGFFQNLAMLTFCLSFPHVIGTSVMREVTENRIIALLRDRVSKDGVFKEHSTTYHMLFMLWHHNLLSHFPLRPKCHAVVAEYVQKMVRRAHDFLLPDGRFAPLGDLCRREVSPFLGKILDNMPSETQSQPFYTLPSSGYGFMRGFCKERPEEDSRVMFCGAFHSRAHKHCDDLHFVWSEGRDTLLTEAGFYSYSASMPKDDPRRAKGFWYSDPRRIYIESAHAHNVVEMDGESYSRAVKPFYGALAMQKGWASEHAAYLAAEWRRPEKYIQRRALILHPRHWLLVLDVLLPQKDAGSEHLFSQWFQLDPSARLLEELPGHRLFAIGETRMFCHDFSGASTSVHRGEEQPRMQGWHEEAGSSLTPSWSVAHHLRGTEARFAALFSIGRPCLDLKLAASSESLTITLAFDDGRENGISLPGILQNFASGETN